ncbi:unnamed protein product [Effrenium voratum]|nr:unnamed protein product [Effrenium voratum]
MGTAAGGSGRCGLQVLEGGAESDAMGDLGESGHRVSNLGLHRTASRRCAMPAHEMRPPQIELYENPGPIQLSGPSAGKVTKTIATRFSYLHELQMLQKHLEALSSRCRPGCELRQVKVACQSLATLNSILDELAEHPAASPLLERPMK